MNYTHYNTYKEGNSLVHRNFSATGTLDHEICINSFELPRITTEFLNYVHEIGGEKRLIRLFNMIKMGVEPEFRKKELSESF